MYLYYNERAGWNCKKESELQHPVVVSRFVNMCCESEKKHSLTTIQTKNSEIVTDSHYLGVAGLFDKVKVSII